MRGVDLSRKPRTRNLEPVVKKRKGMRERERKRKK
jgi:hypothetical protein